MSSVRRKKQTEKSILSITMPPLEPDIARLTGCKPVFQREEVISLLESSVDTDDRYHFLLLSPEAIPYRARGGGGHPSEHSAA